MPAYSEEFPWRNYYGHNDFFENQMKFHSKVSDVSKVNRDGLYKIYLKDKRALKVFICECYSYGLAEYYESVEKLGELDAIR
jgi:hypothetical protein